jgi:hypothetical protein
MAAMTRLVAIAALIVVAAGCGFLGTSTRTQPSPPVAPLSIASEVAAPEWRQGDRWTFEWTSGQERGMRTVEVREAKTINGVAYYVLDVGPTSQQYYTKDLHFAALVQVSRVLARMVPPQPWFVWPLKSGAEWQYHGVFEEQQGSTKQNDTFRVMGIEQVTVAGGTFRAFKVVRQSDRRDADQYWYAPDVRWYVRWIGRRGDVEFEEQVKTYQAVPRLTSTPSTR